MSPTPDKAGADSAKKAKRGLGAKPLELKKLCFLGDDGSLDLTGVLCHLLVAESDAGKTWGQRIVEGWIHDVEKGNPRAIEDILDRNDKRWLNRASDVATHPAVDDSTAGRILEVLCGRGDVAAGD